MITEEIKRRVPDAMLPEPDPRNPEKWHRFPCPFCGRPRAAVNYALGMFRCFHKACRLSLGPYRKPDDRLLITRFQFQIEQAVKSFASKWTGFYRDNKDDEWQYARTKVVEYDRDSTLDNWEAGYFDNPDEIDHLVLLALYRDLIDWAVAQVRQEKRDAQQAELDKEREGFREYGPEYFKKIRFVGELRPVENEVTNEMMWQGWPHLDLAIRHGNTIEQIAKIRGESVSTVKRKMKAEKTEAREALAEGRPPVGIERDTPVAAGEGGIGQRLPEPFRGGADVGRGCRAHAVRRT